jgi:SOS-response transcriptional repressor LexA
MPLPFQKRVAEVLQDQEIKPIALARVAGVTKGLVSQWVNGPAQSMSYESAKKLSAKYGYSIDWLMKGTGPKYSKSSRTGSKKSSVEPADIYGRAPLLSWAQAGRIEEPEGVYSVGDAEEWYPMPKKSGPNTFCLKVSDASMTSPYGRSYPVGCLIFIDPDQRTPTNGVRVIARLESGELTFKEYVKDAGREILKPLNQQYPTITEPFQVVGTVVGKWEDD